MEKKFLDSLGCLALAMAFYAGIWTVLCEATGMLSWIGFAGCTTYFACGKKGLRGIKSAFAANLSGMAWALLSVVLGGFWKWDYAAAILCAFISYMIIMQAKKEMFHFIPGAYIGCFVTFAAGGSWEKILLPMVLGIGLGALTDITGEKLFRQIRESTERKAS